MKAPGILERLDDALNPIVVKELRQAVHSRFVTAVLMFFLIVQLLVIGIYLMVVAAWGQIESIEFQAGREVFSWLQGILLATCMLFLPLYTGVRLAAERSEVNTDLLFITTLRPRAIISGKLISAVVLAVLIFSACTPFMAFTYFLRGIDWPSILLIITGDFLVVIGSVQIMLFIAVIPANRLFKAFLGLIGLGALGFIFAGAFGTSMMILWQGELIRMLHADLAWFWVTVGMFVTGIVGFGGLFFTWSVALISPPSANRSLSVRLYMVGFWLVSGALAWLASTWVRSEIPFAIWTAVMLMLWTLGLIISINERERWSPRIARSIPRWYLRPLALLFYSGAAGGVLLSAIMLGWTALAVFIFRDAAAPAAGPFGLRWEFLLDTLRVMGILALYLSCYAMTAVFIRTWLLRGVPADFTWIVMLVVTAAGSIVPFLIAFALFYREWDYGTHYVWFLGNPVAAMLEMAFSYRSRHAEVFAYFAAGWAALIVLVNLPWFFSQLRRFRPASGVAVAPSGVAPSALTSVPLDATQTAPSG
jgi:hypothetical protein